MQRTVHLTLQGKGGCFKSGITALVAQYLAANAAQAPQCIDTDPVNRTFSRLTALGVQGLELLNDHQQIDSRQFDTMVGRILDHHGDTVIDTGAAVFVPLKAYLVESAVLELLADEGIRTIIHVPLIGGLDFTETVRGLQAILDDLPEADIVAWCNPYFGPVEQEGRGLQDSTLYKHNQNRFAGIIDMMNTDPATFGADINEVRRDGLTYLQAINHPGYSPVARHRLKRVWAYYCLQLDALNLTPQREEVAA
ncbi:conjugal transfer protein TraL [Vogesella oryzae]|uniref:conjugal transfer protein TraL n=1 Tax=Vogesella oryzae TaxID=1735285 RepID=UPI0015828C75|nr:conjugal transfer protein TraL [Vogesella oryzae]